MAWVSLLKVFMCQKIVWAMLKKEEKKKKSLPKSMNKLMQKSMKKKEKKKEERKRERYPILSNKRQP
jgi:hypothetical protein